MREKPDSIEKLEKSASGMVCRCFVVDSVVAAVVVVGGERRERELYSIYVFWERILILVFLNV